MNALLAPRLPLTALLLAGLVSAQTTDYCLPIGTAGARGCQDPQSPTLTNGVAATADVQILYDAGTGILTLVVDNTSPVIAGEENPVITTLAFNMPSAVTGAVLGSQSGSGGATPAFSLQFSPTQSIGVACFGDFSARLSVPGIAGGIGNPLATSFANPAVVLSPVTFTLQLSGAGLALLTAVDFGATLSQNGSYAVAVSARFQGGGLGGLESGYVSSGAPCCPNQPSITTIGTGCAPVGLTLPTLASVGTPGIGIPFGVDISSPATPNAFGLLLVGLQPVSVQFGLPLPLDLGPFGLPGCSLYSSGDAIIGVVTDGAGAASWTIVLPGVTTKFCNVPFDFQAFFATPGGDILNTAGLRLAPGS